QTVPRYGKRMTQGSFTDRNESNFSLVRLVSKLGRSTVIPLDLCQFLSRDLAGAGGSFFEHFADAAVAGFRAAIVEDTEQLVAALRRRHALPALISARITRERDLQDGLQVAFGFQDRKSARRNCSHLGIACVVCCLKVTS